MIALITGASSGIGKQMAFYLSDLGYDLILVARRQEELEKMKKEIKTKVTIYNYDLLKLENVLDLYHKVKNENIDFLINNAGFGLFGKFIETSLQRELEMIDLNIKTYHILMKLFLQDFIKKDHGRILNVASAAGFLTGPNLSTYYATKNYIAKLTIAVQEELKEMKSHVSISVLCPGPVATEFERVAEGKFLIQEFSAKNIAIYSINQALKNKKIIIPGFFSKLGLFSSRFLPWSFIAKIMSKIQKKV